MQAFIPELAVASAQKKPEGPGSELSVLRLTEVFKGFFQGSITVL